MSSREELVKAVEDAGWAALNAAKGVALAVARDALDAANAALNAYDKENT